MNRDNKGRFQKNHKLRLGLKHSEETKQKIKIKMTGQPSHRKGKKYGPLSKEHKQKIKMALKGKKRGKEARKNIKRAQNNRSIEWKRNISKSKIGKARSMSTRIKISLIHTKEKVFLGFHQSLNKRIRNHSKYNNWRMMVFGRDDFTCQECDKRGCFLETHHIKALNIILQENNILTLNHALSCNDLWEIENGITYCKECHILCDNYRGKRGGSNKHV